jgi:hypothetical protein
MAVACSREKEPPSDRPQHPLFKNLQPPPLNRPVRQAPLPIQAPLLKVNAPGVTLVSNGRVFEGTTTLRGRLTVTGERVELVSPEKQILQVLYRLPTGLPALAAFDGEGELLLEDRSTPDGSNRRVILRAGNVLQFGYVAVKATEPVDIDLGGGLRLVQGKPRVVSPQGTLAWAPVEIRLDGAIRADVPSGKPTRFAVGGRVMDAIVEASRWTRAGPKDQHSGGYLLEAWIVAVK